MRKKYKVGLIIIVILIMLLLLLGLSKLFLSNDNKDDNRIKNITSVEMDIKDFGYTLDNRDTRYMRDEFQNLKETLEAEEIDYEKYAESLAKLFVIDFYTLDNKINKYDVGGLEYVLEDKKEDFRLKAMDSIYNDIIDNTYNDRKQDLPEITNVEIISLEETKFTLKEVEQDAYQVKMKYTYEKDLGYDEEGTIYLIRSDNKLVIVSYNPSIQENS